MGTPAHLREGQICTVGPHTTQTRDRWTALPPESAQRAERGTLSLLRASAAPPAGAQACIGNQEAANSPPLWPAPQPRGRPGRRPLRLRDSTPDGPRS